MALEIPPPDALPVIAASSSSSKVSSAISFGLLFVSVIFAIAGQLTLKSAMAPERIGRIGTAQVSRPAETMIKALKEPLLWAGLTLFGVSALFWLIVLSRVPLSVAYPVVGLSYIVIVALARFVLHESVPPLRWVGVGIVALGIAVIGLSSKSVSGP
jgi:drug/metabolite transporter (DMT)-like permease